MKLSSTHFQTLKRVEDIYFKLRPPYNREK